jgi:hypothetical protein
MIPCRKNGLKFFFIKPKTVELILRFASRMKPSGCLSTGAELFHHDKSVISRHIRNVFEEGELKPDSVVANFATTAADGKIYQVDYYNLDVIISVGYRVKSHRGTQFRIWATQRLREYIIKGFTLDDDRLKQAGGGNYFEELLARIRDIRASERSSGARSWTFMPPASTMTRQPISPASFLRWCRTRCTGRPTDIRQQKSLPAGRKQAGRIWA